MARPHLIVRSLSLLVGLHLSVSAQTVIVSYSFEETLTPEIGSAISSVDWNSGGAEGYSPVFSNQGDALSVGGFQLTEYFEITLDATGYRDIMLNSFRSNASASAPANWKISYSLTGPSGTFFDAATYVLNTSTSVIATTVPSFLLPAEADDNDALVLRLVATSSLRIDGGMAAANGTVRLDNVSFSGTAIPEPSTYAALFGIMAMTFCWWQRRPSRRLRR